MEQSFKARFYGKGNMSHVNWIAEKAGIEGKEYDMFVAWHFCKTDEDIEFALGIDKDARIRMEKLIIPKIPYAVLSAIDFCIANEKTQK